MFELFKDTQKSSLTLVQCCAESGKATAGTGGQEWESTLAANIE